MKTVNISIVCQGTDDSGIDREAVFKVAVPKETAMSAWDDFRRIQKNHKYIPSSESPLTYMAQAAMAVAKLNGIDEPSLQNVKFNFPSSVTDNCEPNSKLS